MRVTIASADGSELDRILLGMVDSIYAAAADPARWQEVVDGLVGLLGGLYGNCAVLRPRNQAEAAFWTASSSTPREAIEQYRAYYHEKDLVLDALDRRPDLDGALAIRDLMSHRRFTESESYNDFLKPGGIDDIQFLAFGGQTPLAPMTVVNVLKPRWEETEDERAIYILNTLKPHFERAVRLHWQLGEEQLRSSMALDGLDKLRIGVVMLDKTGAVLMVNQAAERILAARDGFTLSRRRITARAQRDAAELERMIGATVTGERRIEQGGTLAVSRVSGRRPYVVTVVPPRVGSAAERFGASLLFIKDPEDTPFPDADVLMRVFGLTRSQARLCASLAAGQTMQEIAEMAGVSANTLKTHLRGAFARTQTTRQTDLVRLILASLDAARPTDAR